MEYHEVTALAHKFIDDAGGRNKLEELTKNMNLMERATFVQAISATIDYITVGIFYKNNPPV